MISLPRLHKTASNKEVCQYEQMNMLRTGLPSLCYVFLLEKDIISDGITYHDIWCHYHFNQLIAIYVHGSVIVKVTYFALPRPVGRVTLAVDTG